jgi:hypothetical protein
MGKFEDFFDGILQGDFKMRKMGEEWSKMQ